MAKKTLSICSMSVAIILMILPYGIKMTFSSGPSEDFVSHYYSYFSMMPIGYANWLPMITAFLSIIIFVLLVLENKNIKIKKMIQICLFICIVSSLLSWSIFKSLTIIGLFVLIIHISVLVLQVLQKDSKI